MKVSRLVLFVAAPAISLLLAAPPAMMLLPWNLKYLDKIHLFHGALLAFYIGIASAPGYLYALLTESKSFNTLPMVKWWVRLSLAAAAVCSVIGALSGAWMPLFIPTSVIAAYASAVLLISFERSGEIVREGTERSGGDRQLP